MGLTELARGPAPDQAPASEPATGSASRRIWRDGEAPQVFISYRVDLSEDAAAHLCHRLQGELGHHRVFFDKTPTSLPPGCSWEDGLADALDAPELRVVVAIVHRDSWTHAPPGDPPRFEADGDFVRRELEVALRRRQSEPGRFHLIIVRQTHDVPTVDGHLAAQQLDTTPLPVWPDESELPDHPGERAQLVLRHLTSIQVDPRHTLKGDGYDAVVESVAAALRSSGEVLARDASCLGDLLALPSKERPGRLELLDELDRHGEGDDGTVALAAALRLLVHADFDAARTTLTRILRRPRYFAEGAQQPDDAYWAAFTGLVAGLAELGGERPRKLPSMGEARELMRGVLLPAYDSLDRAEQASAGPSSVDDTRRHLAALLQYVTGDYFESRGLSMGATLTGDADLKAAIRNLLPAEASASILEGLAAQGLVRFSPESGHRLATATAVQEHA